MVSLEAAACPLPTSSFEHVLLGHGSGGRLTEELLRQVFLPAFRNEILDKQEDQADLPLAGDAHSGKLAFTTDSFVVRPIFFPGGDIGKLAVCGTINDLAVGGAKPLYLSAAFILEEGLPLSDLRRVVESMRTACLESGVQLVTGDTKVVDRGKGDQLYVTTSGLGLIPAGRALSIRSARPGDHILLSGTLGDHGMAIMSLREGLEFGTVLESDCASIVPLAEATLGACPETRCMRDPTRGGVAGVLHELAVASEVGVKIDEARLPIRNEVRGACEILGLDPLFVANEGKLIAVVPPERSEAVLAAMRRHPLGRQAEKIGEVVAEHKRRVTLRSLIGGERIITPFAGELLPRIC